MSNKSSTVTGEGKASRKPSTRWLVKTADGRCFQVVIEQPSSLCREIKAELERVSGEAIIDFEMIIDLPLMKGGAQC